MQQFLNIALSTALELLRQPVFLILLAGSLAFIAIACRPLFGKWFPGWDLSARRR